MTLSTTASRAEYAGNGVTTAFSFPFYFIADADLVVLLRTTATGVDVTQVLDTDYAVTDEGEQAGGTVTFTVAPASGKTVIIYRDPAQTQGTDLEEAGQLSSETLETAFDRAVMLIQTLAGQLARAIRFPAGDSASLTSQIPNAVTRASKFLSFDASGNVALSATPTIDSSVMVVVSASDPGHANGRIWIDTATVDHLLAKQSDGSDWTQIWDYDTAANTISIAIVNDTITNAKLANMATATFKGRTTAGTGDPEDLTVTQATALLNAFTSALKGLAPASGGGTTNFLRADGSWAVPLDTSKIVQVVHTGSGEVGTTTAVIPDDDTIPQSGEGGEFLSLAITPTNASNFLLIEAVVNARTANDDGLGVALFHVGVANALAAVQQADFDADVGCYPINFKHRMVAGTTSAMTFQLRVGPLSTGTVTINGVAGARKFGGAMASTITITEIAA